MARDDKRKFKSVRRKKKKCFSGKRWQNTLTFVNNNTNPEQSTSVLPLEGEFISTKKLLNSSFQKFEDNKHILINQKA